jgi:hypothetical protein
MEDKHNKGNLKLPYIRIIPSINFSMDFYPSLDLIPVIAFRKLTKAGCNILCCFGYETQYMHLKIITIHFCVVHLNSGEERQKRW